MIGNRETLIPLACPNCLDKLEVDKTGAICLGCDTKYPRSDEGQLDLRIHGAKTTNMRYEINGVTDPAEDVFRIDPPKPKFQPEEKLSADTPSDDRGTLTNLVEQIPPTEGDAVCIELGMRTKRLKQVCESAGYQYIAIDYDSPYADILGDGHALPLPDGSCGLVISHKVFEHVKNPFIVANDIKRVLSAGGYLIGGVAFLEPFHGNSHLHHSHKGIYHVLASAGFNVEAIFPGWEGLSALSELGLFRFAPKSLARVMILPVNLAHRIYYKIGYTITGHRLASEKLRRFGIAGEFIFIAQN